MSDTSVPPKAQPARPARTRRANALAGTLGGLLGGTLAGGLGCLIGLSITHMAPPDPGTIVPNVRDGVVLGGLAAGAAGLLAGLVIGRPGGQRRVFVWTGVVAFFSVLVSAIEIIEDQDVGNGVRIFVLHMVLFWALVAAWPWLLRGLWRLRWVLLGWLGLCLIGEVYGRQRAQSFTDPSSVPDEPVVQLGYSPLPSGLGRIAVHYHFTTF